MCCVSALHRADLQVRRSYYAAKIETLGSQLLILESLASAHCCCFELCAENKFGEIVICFNFRGARASISTGDGTL